MSEKEQIITLKAQNELLKSLLKNKDEELKSTIVEKTTIKDQLVQNELLKSLLKDKDEELKSAIVEKTTIKNQLKQKEDELSELMPMLSIGKQIEIFEYLVTPELHDPMTVFNHPALAKWKTTNHQVDYHEAKWLVILSKTSDARVDKLLKLLHGCGISHTDFCRRIGGFFIISPGSIHVPPLKQYSAKKMKSTLQNKFGIWDDVTIKCITDVLMKIV